MDSVKLGTTLMVLANTGKFCKDFMTNHRELSEEEIAYLIDEGYILCCGSNRNDEKVYCVSQKGKEYWRK